MKIHTPSNFSNSAVADNRALTGTKRVEMVTTAFTYLSHLYCPIHEIT